RSPRSATGGHPVHSWNGAQLFHFLFKRAKMLSDFLLQPRDLRFHKLQVFHQFLQQEPMMRLHAPFQGNSGILFRSNPRDISASFFASPSPSIIAFSIARPDAPSASVATEASLMLASSSTF